MFQCCQAFTVATKVNQWHPMWNVILPTVLPLITSAYVGMAHQNNNHGFTPSLELANDMLIRKSIIADSVKTTVELAAELVGGPGFFKDHAMERIVRDVRAIHYHPLPVRRQQVFSGRVALGHDPVVD